METATGISMKQQGHGIVVISKITPDSLFASTPLRAGLQVLKVNDCPITDMYEAAGFIGNTSGLVTVLARPHPSPSPVDNLVVASILKNDNLQQ
jgi:hypothetical protein